MDSFIWRNSDKKYHSKVNTLKEELRLYVENSVMQFGQPEWIISELSG